MSTRPTALLALKIKEYRNLITYEIIDIQTAFGIVDNKICPTDAGEGVNSAGLSTYYVKIINRGWRSASDVRLHAEGDFPLFSVSKKADSISPETISVRSRDNVLEVLIDFLPPKEELIVTFSTKQWAMLYKFTGAGKSYELRPIHFLIGYKNGLSAIKIALELLLFSILLGLLIAQYGANDRLRKDNERLYDRSINQTASQTSPSSGVR